MTVAPDQADTVAFLQGLAARSGDDGKDGGGRIDTHGAHVFLAGNTAYKLKRAVTYDYMDLGTPDLRRAMLERELELNAPTAPTIYSDVLPVTRGPDGLRLGGTGPVVDWVLRMNRFPAEDELEAIAERGALDGALADALGLMVARYHATCPKVEADGAVLIRAILDELERVFAAFAGAAGTADVDAWMVAARDALGAVAPLLTARGAGGRVRRGHGDLHLRNIVLIDAAPVPFDALEFDETLGTCDVLYDFGFLLMDLCHRNLAEAATRALAQYLLHACGEDDAGLAALPLFISVRAAIRAMVLLQTDRARAREGASAAEVAAYLGEAIRALAPASAVLVAVGGLSGTGKTVLARALAPGLGAPPGAVHLSTDAERKAARGIAATEHLPKDAYAAEARGAVYVALMRRAETILRTGYSVILDGTFLDPAQRACVDALGARRGVATACFWLAADAGVLEDRVRRRTGDASDADVAVLRWQLQADVAGVEWHRLDASGPPDATVAAARVMLERVV